MKKSISRILTAVLSSALIISTLTGCAGKSENKNDSANTNAQQSSGNTLPIVTKPITLKYWKALGTSQAKIIKDYNENEAYKELEKRTGIHIEFLSPPAGQETEQYKLLIASGDLPDMIEHHWYAKYPGGPDKAIEDGVFLKLNDYIDKYAPNFKKVRESDKYIGKLTITDSGNIWSFPMIQQEDELPWNGPILRQDWVEELGLKMPATISDWYTMLKAFKEKKNVQAPLIIPKNGYDDHYAFIGAYGVGAKFFRVGDKVKYGPIEPGFKDYITEMTKWYSEGLIDKDFMTRDGKTTDAMVLSDKIGAWTSSYGAGLDSYILSKKNDPKVKISAVAYPSLKPGEKVHLRNRNENNKGYDTVITSKCKYPVEAVKWLDYHYSKDGFMLFNWGIEGVSYNKVNNKPQFTDLIIKNPDGLSYDVINWKYKLHVGTYLRDWRAYKPFSDAQENAMKVWNEAMYDYVMPPVTLTVEEAGKEAAIMSEIYTYVNQMVLKFIVGQEPLSKYDSFVSQIKKMNIDEAVSIYQKAYDRFNKR